MSFMFSTATAAEKKMSNVKPGVMVWRNKVVLVQLTGSRIPQHVLIHGQTVDSASPVYVVENDNLHRTGAVSIVGMLSLDPSITSGVPRVR
jgi:hypothetical protein